MNYFSHQTAAERYASGRPYLHPVILQHICEFIGRERFGSVLDVACGTGQSSQAALKYADHVIGMDISAEMLSQAKAATGMDFLQALAEELPFAEKSFDLITVGLAFHWFDQNRFLREANRVLRSSGHLVIYNSGFLGEFTSCPEFAEWNACDYLPRYPIPSRVNRPVTQDWGGEFGFTLAAHQSFDTEFPLTHEQLVNYLLTQSNVIAAVEQGREKLEDVTAWIRSETAQFFATPTGPARFRIHIDDLIKN